MKQRRGRYYVGRALLAVLVAAIMTSCAANRDAYEDVSETSAQKQQSDIIADTSPEPSMQENKTASSVPVKESEQSENSDFPKTEAPFRQSDTEKQSSESDRENDDGLPENVAPKKEIETASRPNVESAPTLQPEPTPVPEPEPTPVPEPELTPESVPEPSATDMGESYKADVLAGVNSYRQTQLSMDSSLSSTAQAHAEAMAISKSTYHSCRGVESVGSGAYEEGYTQGVTLTVHCSTLAEEKVVRIGVGAARDENGSIYVCIYGKTY